MSKVQPGSGRHLDRYAVIGHPVDHSKSPTIHAAFAASTQQALRYDKLNAPLDGFEASVRGFIAGGGRGLNVTIPFKVEAFEISDTLTPRARAAGAVNTLRFDETDEGLTIVGDNTDGAGLVRDLEQNLGCQIALRKILLLGAGGAARGVIQPLLARGPAHLTIVNRTAGRARELQRRFGEAAREVGCRLLAEEDANVSRGAFVYDVVINATSSSLSGDLPIFDAGAIGPNTFAYDMMYGATPTIFMRHAAARGAQTADGLGMLVEQAAESFLLWRGVRPESKSVLQRLRADVAGGSKP